jgi:hypothetical protein
MVQLVLHVLGWCCFASFSKETAASKMLAAKIQLHSTPEHHDTLQMRKLDDYPRQYTLWNSEEIRNKLVEWKALYPNLLRITTSQEEYGLPRSGGADDCPFDEGGDGCLHYIVTMQDFVAHPEGSESSNNLPEVFWSGCVHGK